MKKFIYTAMSFAPALAMAQTFDGQYFVDIVNVIGDIVALLIPIIFALAIVYFFWGLAKYVRSAGDPKAAAEGKSIMIWGLLAIAVMASLYGLINWLQGIFNVSGDGTVNLPEVPGL